MSSTVLQLREFATVGVIDALASVAGRYALTVDIDPRKGIATVEGPADICDKWIALAIAWGAVEAPSMAADSEVH